MAGNETLVGLTGGPNVRSTADIIWSCGSTIFICTWTTLHLNVPGYGSTQVQRFWYKLQLMLVGLLAPEYVAGIAFTEFRTALILRRYMHNAGSKDWSMKQSYFVLMGGYMISDGTLCRPVSAETCVTWHSTGNLTIRKMPYAVRVAPSSIAASHFVHFDPDKDPKPELLERARSLASGDEVIHLPWISEQDIDDRGKADYLLKSIACCQIMWLVIQYIARSIQGLATSTLEVTSIAYVACALFSYAAWWKKPYDLQAPVIAYVARTDKIACLLDNADDYISFNDDPEIEVDGDIFWTYALPSIAAFLAYSSLHFLAWNHSFVTVTEKWMWRGSTIAAVAFHVFFFGIGIHLAVAYNDKLSAAKGTRICTTSQRKLMPEYMTAFMEKHGILRVFEEKYNTDWLTTVLMCVVSLAYLVARMYLLAEAFAGLRLVPPSMYVSVDWTKFFMRIT